ncbi:hypothetical protein D3C72_1060470 [compost metagenome]
MRRAVPPSTTLDKALRRALATSAGITRTPWVLAGSNTVAKGVSLAKERCSIRRVGARMPPFWMIPINSAKAAGLSPELPRAVAREGTR